MSRDNSFERDKQPKTAHELVSGLNSLREYYIAANRNTMFEAIQRNPNLQVVPEITQLSTVERTPEVRNVIPISRSAAPEVRVSNEQVNDVRPNQYTKPVIVTPVNPTPDPVDMDYQNMTVKPMSDMERIQAEVDRALNQAVPASEDPSLAVLRNDHFDRPDQNIIGSQGIAAWLKSY